MIPLFILVIPLLTLTMKMTVKRDSENPPYSVEMKTTHKQLIDSLQSQKEKYYAHLGETDRRTCFKKEEEERAGHGK